MKVLGIDYGRKRIGVAVGIDGVIETRPVIETDKAKRVSAIRKICDQEGVGRLIVGVSEGKAAQEARRFAKMLSDVLKLSVELIDETLTTREAEILKKKSRREGLDSVAAAILLERFWLKKGGP